MKCIDSLSLKINEKVHRSVRRVEWLLQLTNVTLIKTNIGTDRWRQRHFSALLSKQIANWQLKCFVQSKVKKSVKMKTISCLRSNSFKRLFEGERVGKTMREKSVFRLCSLFDRFEEDFTSMEKDFSTRNQFVVWWRWIRWSLPGERVVPATDQNTHQTADRPCNFMWNRTDQVELVRTKDQSLLIARTFLVDHCQLSHSNNFLHWQKCKRHKINRVLAVRWWAKRVALRSRCSTWQSSVSFVDTHRTYRTNHSNVLFHLSPNKFEQRKQKSSSSNLSSVSCSCRVLFSNCGAMFFQLSLSHRRWQSVSCVEGEKICCCTQFSVHRRFSCIWQGLIDDRMRWLPHHRTTTQFLETMIKLKVCAPHCPLNDLNCSTLIRSNVQRAIEGDVYWQLANISTIGLISMEDVRECVVVVVVVVVACPSPMKRKSCALCLMQNVGHRSSLSLIEIGERLTPLSMFSSSMHRLRVRCSKCKVKKECRYCRWEKVWCAHHHHHHQRQIGGAAAQRISLQKLVRLCFESVEELFSVIAIEWRNKFPFVFNFE